MAHFSFSMSTLFGNEDGAAVALPRRLQPLPTLVDEDDESQGGPGWYESSHDLRRGLLVSEPAAGDLAFLECLGACHRAAAGA